MTSPEFPANIQVVENSCGVLYRMKRSKGHNDAATATVIVFLLAVGVPAGFGVLGIISLASSFPLLPSWRVALCVPFSLQMSYVAYLAIKWGRNLAWQSLVRGFGRFEFGIQRDRVVLGARLGPFRRYSRWNVSRVKRLVVCVYPEKPVMGAPTECGNLAVELDNEMPRGEERAPIVLVSGYSRKEIVALAEHFNQRMKAVGKGFVQARTMPAVEVIEIQNEAASAAPQTTSMQTRMVRSLPFHMAGAVSLWFFTPAIQLLDWHHLTVRTLWVAAGLLECLIVLSVISAWRYGGKKGTLARRL
jgi:hypothetical protein